MCSMFCAMCMLCLLFGLAGIYLTIADLLTSKPERRGLKTSGFFRENKSRSQSEFETKKHRSQVRIFRTRGKEDVYYTVFVDQFSCGLFQRCYRDCFQLHGNNEDSREIGGIFDIFCDIHEATVLTPAGEMRSDHLVPSREELEKNPDWEEICIENVAMDLLNSVNGYGY